MKDVTKKNILKFISFYIFVLLILLATITIVIYLSVFYLEIINYNLDLIGVINVSLITMLVLITGAYGYFTWQIVDDQKKSRKVAFIERRLEKLYYPTKDVLTNPITVKDPNSLFVVEIAWKKVEEIAPFQYLAYEKSKDTINEFIEKVIKSKTEYEGALMFSNFENGELKSIINDDIEMYENELNELTYN